MTSEVPAAAADLPYNVPASMNEVRARSIDRFNAMSAVKNLPGVDCRITIKATIGFGTKTAALFDCSGNTSFRTNKPKGVRL